MLKRIIPSSGESLPAIGFGTWQTFDTKDQDNFKALEEVLRQLHGHGGSLIDSSPMYGHAEKTIGDITARMPEADAFFYATKVWTEGAQAGRKQMEDSFAKMQRGQLDLIQIHNLLDWQVHLPLLREWKEQGRIRYIGITHYLDSSHEELEQLLRKEKFDFVQFNYSIAARNAEKRLLDACSDLGVATLINRPLGQGNLFQLVKGKPLPGWAVEFGMDNWANFFLKYILAHKAVTCVIPATSKPAHAIEILKAGEGELPGEAMQKKMADHISSL